MAQADLEKIIERYNHIIAGAGLGSWDWWLQTNVVTFDHKWSEMIGLTPQETPQQLSTWESRVHPDDLTQCYKDIKDYLAGKTPLYENVHRMKHKNGSWVWILDRGRISEWDKDGNPIRFTGTHFDITEQKN